MKKSGKRRLLSGLKYWDIWVLITLLALLELQLASGVKYVKSKPTVSRFIKMNRTSVNRTNNYFVPLSVVTLPTTTSFEPSKATESPTHLTTTQSTKLIFHPLTVLETDLDLSNEKKLANSSKEEGKKMNYYSDFPYHPDYTDNLADEGTVSLRITPHDARHENPYPYEKIQPSPSASNYNSIRNSKGSKSPFGKETSGHYPGHHYHHGPHGHSMHNHNGPNGNDPHHAGYFEAYYDDYEEFPLKTEASQPPPKHYSHMESFDGFFRQYKLVAWGIAFGAGSLALLSLLIYVYINNPPTEVVTARRLLDGIFDDPRIRQFLDSLTNNNTKRKKREKAN